MGPLSPEYVIGGSFVAIFFLGNPSVINIIIIVIIAMIVLLVVSWVTVFTFTVCFHRLSSLLHHKNTQKLFTYQPNPFLIFSVSIMYFPTAHFLFCNSEIFYNDRLKLISKISIEKKMCSRRKLCSCCP